MSTLAILAIFAFFAVKEYFHEPRTTRKARKRHGKGKKTVRSVAFVKSEKLPALPEKLPEKLPGWVGRIWAEFCIMVGQRGLMPFIRSVMPFVILEMRLGHEKDKEWKGCEEGEV